MFKSASNGSHISKNDNVRANQQEMLNDFNIRINKKLKDFNSSSETTRATSFNEWLGGLMDADGCFYLSKKNYLSCEITVPVREHASLSKIKAKFGGTISKRSKVNALRWRLHKKDQLIPFLLALNGNIYFKVAEYVKVVQIYIPEIHLVSKDFSNSGAWLSGFFEGDGHVNINKANYMLSICIGQKDKTILDKIKNIYGGTVFYDKSWEGYTWQVSSKEGIIRLFEYFTIHPLQSVKNSEIFSAKKFFRYKLNKYHLNESRRKFLDRFIKIFQSRKKI